jgi:hypothetical protein
MAMLLSLIVAGWPGVIGRPKHSPQPESGEAEDSLAQLDSGGINLVVLGMI